MERQLRIAVTSFGLVLASCSGGPVSDFPVADDDEDYVGAPARGNDAGTDQSEQPGASNGSGNSGSSGGSADPGTPSNSRDAGVPPRSDAGQELASEAGVADGGLDASDGAMGVVP